MRTTIRMHEDLLRQAKRGAAEAGATLTSFIEEAVREKLARRKRPAGKKPAPLKTFGGKGLCPGVNLDDTAELLDLMERRE